MQPSTAEMIGLVCREEFFANRMPTPSRKENFSATGLRAGASCFIKDDRSSLFAV